MASISEQLLKAMKASGLTRYRISKETGVSESTLSKFVNRKGGLSMEAIDKIGKLIGMGLVEKSPGKGQLREK